MKKSAVLFLKKRSLALQCCLLALTVGVSSKPEASDKTSGEVASTVAGTVARSSVVMSDAAATELVKRAETHLEGKSFQGRLSMVVDRDGSQRTLGMQVWMRGREAALIKISKPPKDRGTGNLRLKMDLWQYLPNVNRVIRVPSSMMLQSWMGSDFTNDDLVRASSLLNDYTHKILTKEESPEGRAVKIELTPKKDAAVVWGKVLLWVREKDAAPIKQEFYNEKSELVKVMQGESLHQFGSHVIPLKMKMTNVKKNGQFTAIEYDEKSIRFDEVIADEVFTQMNLQRPVQGGAE